jgi:hypothetical protein
MAALGLAACAGGPDGSSMAAPTAPLRVLTTASAGDPGDRTANQGELEICKDGDAASFQVTPLGGTPVTVNLTDGECRVIVVDKRSGLDTLRLTVTELPSMTSTFTSVKATTVHNEYDPNIQNGGPDVLPLTVVTSTSSSTVNVKINEYIGTLLEYVNTKPSTGCTYTKGWYRNNGSNTIIDNVDGRSIANQQAIFGATPGKPGGVTWGANNNNLNLYQQLLAALNNLGGNATGGPDAVDAAISAALGATGGSGKSITVNAGTDVSGLINVLSAFNEGTFAGWPHCDD